MASVTVNGLEIEVPPFPPEDLLEDDGEPLETLWHRKAMILLIDSVEHHLQPRTDFVVGGNHFIYYTLEQARDILEKGAQTSYYRGPDFFFVDKVSRQPMRRYWAVWNEGGRYPDLIIELMSPTTAKTDLTVKKDIYERTFRTYEYYCYDPDTGQLRGWRLVGNTYQGIVPNEKGWLWCETLLLWLGTWQGTYVNDEALWLRFYDAEGKVVPVDSEAAHQRADAERQRADAEQQRADAERQRAETERQRAETERQRAEAEHDQAKAERQRAEALEAELKRLQALLAQQLPGQKPPDPS